MFADPQSLTIATVPVSLPRVAAGINTGTFKSNDGLVSLSLSHAYGKQRTRRVVRVNHAKIAADPFVPSANARYSMSSYIVTDVPLTGYTVPQQQEVLTAFLAWCTPGRLLSVLGGEI